MTDVRAVLEAVRDRPVAPPDPTFLQRLEADLVRRRPTAGPVALRRRPFLPAAAAVAAAAVAIGFLVGIGTTDHRPDRVETVPSEVTTSTSTPTSTSTAPGTTPEPTTTATSVAVAPTTSTSAVAPAPTTTAPTTPTTVAPTSTTTTAPAAPADLHLTCTTDAATPSISCRWDASTAAGVTYRLTRHTGDGPTSTAYEGPGTQYTEASRQGARLFYDVVARTPDGATVGTGSTVVTCC